MLGFFLSFQPLTLQFPKDPFHFSSPECHHDSKLTICSSISKINSSFPCANAFSTFPLLMIKGPLTTQNHDCTYLYCLYAVSAPKIHERRAKYLTKISYGPERIGHWFHRFQIQFPTSGLSFALTCFYGIFPSFYRACLISA